MANYEVGNLDVAIMASNANAISSLDDVISRLNSLSSVLKTITKTDLSMLTQVGTRITKFNEKLASINLSNTVNSVALLSSTLAPLANTLQTITKADLSTLTKLGNRLQAIGTKMTNIDWTTVSAGFNQLTTAITPFIDKVNTAQTSLVALNSVLSRVKNTNLTNITDNLATSSTATARAVKNINLGGILGKIRLVSYIARRIANSSAKIVQYGSDYAETLNMWQVAMGGNVEKANEFITSMRTAYGISTQTLMQNQAIFKNMVSTMGEISDTAAYNLSEGLSQMVLDYASLWNTTIDSASEKFQAMLSGQIRPIRSISGIDVSETSIYSYYQQLGGTKTMRQLTQIEKRLLRIYATYSQMQEMGAGGDFAKTIEQWANQSKLISENSKEAATWIGISAKYFLQESGFLQKINTYLIVTTEIAKSLASAMGYIVEDFSLKGVEEQTENAGDALDTLKGKLFDFDKFQTLGSAKDTDSALGIDQKIIDLFTDYQSELKNTTYAAQKMAETMLSGLGLQKVYKMVDEQGNIVEKTADEYAALSEEEKKAYSMYWSSDNLKKIAKILEALLETLLDLKIVLWSVAGILAGTALTTHSTQIITATKSVSKWAAALMQSARAAVQYTRATSDAEEVAERFVENAERVEAGAIAASGAIGKVFTNTWMTVGAFIALTAGIGLTVKNWNKLSETAKILIPTLSALAAIIAGIGIAIAVFKSGGNWVHAGITAAALAGGIGLVAGTLGVVAKYDKYADGGYPDKGTLFIAGEAGTEMVANVGGGRSAVANIAEIEEAQYKGNMRAFYAQQRAKSATFNGSSLVVNIGGTKFVEVTKEQLAKAGYKLVRA